MARGRMLNKSISLSQKFDQLPDDTCRLLATWIIPQLDYRGVFYADPAIVRNLIFPTRVDITIPQVAGYLEAMECAGLIVRFTGNGRIWQVWPGFSDNQTGLRIEREKTSFPLPPGALPDDDSMDDGKMPDKSRQDDGKESAEDKLNHESQSEDKSNDSGAGAPEDESQKQVSDEKPEKPKQELSPLARHFKALWGVKFINSSQLEVIGEMEKAYPYDRVVEVSKWAHKNNMPLGKALSAIETALPKWGQKGANGNVGKSNGSHSGRVPARNPEYKVAKASDFDPIVGDGANAHGP